MTLDPDGSATTGGFVPMKRLLWLAAIWAGCVDSTDVEVVLNEKESEIANAKAVAATDLLGMVTVQSAIGSCSGMVISETAVLTAAHCVCTESYVGGNVCHLTATVFFRPSPSGTPGGQTSGTVVFDPDYNPSWIDGHIKHDLAIIHIPFGSRPIHAQPFTVASAYTPLGAQVMLAGFGHTGSDCEGPFGTLNWDNAVIDSYEDDGGVVTVGDDEWCGGDSGGALLLADGSLSPTKLVGVISSTHPISGNSKANPTWSHFTEWIRPNVPDLNVPLVPAFSNEQQQYTGLDFGLPSTWEPITGDFNGDGRTDYARVGASGAWVFLAQPGTGFTTGFQVYNGLWFDQPSQWQTITGDFNGDGRTDYARLGATGAWIFSGQPSGGFTQGFQVYQGLNFELPSTWEPITGDFNGDGVGDYARVGATGAWFFTGHSWGFSQGFHTYSGLSFGQPSAWQTITGDFNGDGKTDYARLGAGGAWIFETQPNGSFAQGFQIYSGLNFGLPSPWEPITGDFNGDGKTDYARIGATGAWLFEATGNGFTQGFQDYGGLSFGIPSPWKTITGDFNGDGKTDYARLGSTGAWIFSGSSDPNATFATVFQVYPGGTPLFGLPSQWQTITGRFNGGTRWGYARLGGTTARVFRGL